MRIADAYRRGNRLWLILDDCTDAYQSADRSQDLAMDAVLIKASERRVNTVSINASSLGEGSEDLISLLVGLKRMGKNVELSISPLLSDIIEKTLGMVGSYVLDCDPAGNDEDFLSDPELHRSLATLLGRNVIIRKTIGSDEPTLEEIERLGEAVASVAKTAILHQNGMGSIHGMVSRSIPDNIASEDRMLKLGRALSYHVPHVILRGEGFRVELNRH